MTPAEFYTAQFYSWECRGRGWYVSDYPVQLEPPFIPYLRQGFPREHIDDGKRHTLVSKFLENLNGKHKPNTGDQNLLDYETLEPFEYKAEIHLRTLQVKLSKDRRITPERMKALLIMLSYINTPVSFEIIGTGTEIIIQFVCDEVFIDTLETYINAYFPQCAVIQSNVYLETILQEHLSTAVVDFGLKHEFIRPINTTKNFSLDPLIGFLGVLDKLGADEQAGMQILFQPALNQWSESIIRSVTMYDGTSFFTDAPEAPLLAKEKVQSPLYGVSIRTFAQAIELTQAFALLERISFAIINGSKGNTNQLIPLSTQSYDFQTRVDDILLRESHRLGMLLNVDELISLVHFPSETINSKKLFTASRKTTETPAIAQGKAFILGENNHNGIKTTVSFGLEDRLKHTHIIGATGTGKSTLICNSIGTGYGNELIFTTAYLIGELFGGGRVFYVDNTKIHGLIVALTDQAAGAKWDSNTSTWISPNAYSFTDGVLNTNKIITVLGAGNAAGACRTYTGGGFNDWYLPARNELNILHSQRNVMNNYNTYFYWTSTESTSYIGFASAINFGGGTISDNSLKNQIYHVRAIRAF